MLKHLLLATGTPSGIFLITSKEVGKMAKKKKAK